MKSGVPLDEIQRNCEFARYRAGFVGQIPMGSVEFALFGSELASSVGFHPRQSGDYASRGCYCWISSNGERDSTDVRDTVSPETARTAASHRSSYFSHVEPAICARSANFGCDKNPVFPRASLKGRLGHIQLLFTRRAGLSSTLN